MFPFVIPAQAGIHFRWSRGRPTNPSRTVSFRPHKDRNDPALKKEQKKIVLHLFHQNKSYTKSNNRR